LILGEEVPIDLVNGTGKTNKAKIDQTNVDTDDEQERDKNIPILHDVADVVWVKMGGHPW
jgi:predicted amino acid racemase